MLADPLLTHLEHLRDEFVARREVVVESRRADAHGAGDLGEPGLGVAAHAQRRRGRGEDPLPGPVRGGRDGAPIPGGSLVGGPHGMVYPPLTENSWAVTCRAARSDDSHSTAFATSAAIVRRRRGVSLSR